MLLYSRKKKNPKIEKTLTLRDMKEVHSKCLVAIGNIIPSNSSENEENDIKNDFIMEIKEKPNKNHTMADFKTKHFKCYLGGCKPKNIPKDHKTRPMNWDTLVEAIRQNDVQKIKGKHHAIIFHMIQKGYFGTGYENMKQVEYSRKLKDEYNFGKSIGRSNLSGYIKDCDDPFLYSLSISNYVEKYQRLSINDEKKIKEQDELRCRCGIILGCYWKLILDRE